MTNSIISIGAISDIPCNGYSVRPMCILHRVSPGQKSEKNSYRGETNNFKI